MPHGMGLFMPVLGAFSKRRGQQQHAPVDAKHTKQGPASLLRSHSMEADKGSMLPPQTTTTTITTMADLAVPTTTTITTTMAAAEQVRFSFSCVAVETYLTDLYLCVQLFDRTCLVGLAITCMQLLGCIPVADTVLCASPQTTTTTTTMGVTSWPTSPTTTLLVRVRPLPTTMMAAAVLPSQTPTAEAPSQTLAALLSPALPLPVSLD